jgi:hypothetical protein
MIFNLYSLYQYNIWHLINNYNLKYYWLDISKEKFYNGIHNGTFNDFSEIKEDPWLQKYSSNKIELAKDILNKGTFTPFIYYIKDNKKYILLGRHRIYSLNLLKNINKKFLFIELPNIDKKEIYKNKKPLWFYSNCVKDPCLESKVCSNRLIFDVLLNTGDTLTPYLWENQCIPFKPFNDEKLFEEWLNTPMKELQRDIDI